VKTLGALARAARRRGRQRSRNGTDPTQVRADAVAARDSAPEPEDDRWARLTTSAAVRERQIAFTSATGVPVALLSARAHPGPIVADAHGVEGCLGDPGGRLCERTLLRAETRAVTRRGLTRYRCPGGLLKLLVPVFIGGVHAGSLLAGPFAVQSSDRPVLAALVRRLHGRGLGPSVDAVQTAWRVSPLLSSEECRAVGTLLRSFARYLEALGSRMVLGRPLPRSAFLRTIEGFLAERGNTRVSLNDVAARVYLSPCRFCTVFKQQTGLTFTGYRTRLRLEKARRLLLAGEHRVGDVAVAAGFESISHFNRAFRRQFGCAPSQLRPRPRKSRARNTTIQA
jgi:AraC-like DNA-binding protein